MSEEEIKEKLLEKVISLNSLDIFLKESARSICGHSMMLTVFWRVCNKKVLLWRPPTGEAVAVSKVNSYQPRQVGSLESIVWLAPKVTTLGSSISNSVRYTEGLKSWFFPVKHSCLLVATLTPRTWNRSQCSGGIVF